MRKNRFNQDAKRAMKTFLRFILLFSFVLAGCNRDDMPTEPQTGDRLATFTVEVPALTRATVNGLSRYIVEAYEGKDLQVAPLRTESADGTLSLTLKKNTEYTFVFWADYGTANANNGYWDATKLQGVKVVAGKENTVGEAAYCFVVSFNSKDFEANKTVVLKNATAQVNFVEADGLAAGNTLKVTYTQSATLNVATGAVTEEVSDVIHTFTTLEQTAANETLATDYVLASRDGQSVINIKVQLNSETEKTIDNVPFRQNYRTNIKGEYSNLYASTFSISNEVEDYENNPDVEFPVKVGDFYMKDGTWLSGTTVLTAQQQADCIGIIYWVGDPTVNDAALKAAHPNCTHGLVVALKEENSAWQSPYEYDKPVNTWTTTNTTYAPIISGQELIDPINKIMGYNNTKAIEAFNAANSAYKVEAIEKVAAYQAAVETPASNSGWFLPSMKELALLCGLANQESNVYNDKFGKGNRDAINAQLDKITNSTQISKNFYWSSTEFSFGLVWFVVFDGGATGTNYKTNNSGSVRVVSAF